MTITETEYHRIGKGIEIRRYQVATEMARLFPYSYQQFDEGTELAKDEIINDFYKRLDRSITDEEMVNFRKYYAPNKNPSPRRNTQARNAGRP